MYKKPQWSPWIRTFAWLPRRITGRWVWLRHYEYKYRVRQLNKLECRISVWERHIGETEAQHYVDGHLA